LNESGRILLFNPRRYIVRRHKPERRFESREDSVVAIVYIRQEPGYAILGERIYSPGWIELDVLHVGLENRAFALRASDLRPSFPYLLSVSEQLGLEICDVDEHEVITGLEVTQNPAGTLHVHADLIDAALQRNVEGCKGSRADGAVNIENEWQDCEAELP
jgi:hypothetical protein